MNYVLQDYLNWRAEYPDKRVVIGETGWPSDGPARGEAVPSLKNQQRFFYNFLRASRQHGIEFYYFDAFDELWKREGGVGSHWGYLYADRTGKHEVQSVLAPIPHVIFLPLVLKGGPAAAVVGQRIPDPRLWSERFPAPSVLDVPEDQFTVFGEYCAGENHFAPSGWMGDWGDLGVYECERTDPHSGEVSIRISYAAQGPKGWAGIYWQEPDGNWGKIEGAGYDLDEASSLRFHAKGDKGNEQIRLFMGGIWGDFPDSQQPALSTDMITLTHSWEEYTLDLRGRDLSQVIGGFGFVTDQCLNFEPITFYLDDIHYVLDGDPGPPTPTPTPGTPYTFDVYRDRDIAGNHFVPSGWMGDIGDIWLDECWRGGTHAGSTAIRAEYTAEGAGPHECEGAASCGWAGVYWLHPAENWGDRPGGYDLTGARALTFWARGEIGGEKITFKMGGVGCGSTTYPDSLCPVRVIGAPIVLTTTWQVYTVPLSADLDLSSLVGGFLWAASQVDNPNGATFYLDDIQYHFNIDIPPTFFSSPPIQIGPGGDRTFALAFGDADNDGDPDLAVGNHGTNRICWNQGDGSFGCEPAFGGGLTFDMDWGDLNNDEYVDLVVGSGGGQANRVFLNDQEGNFLSQDPFSVCSGGTNSCGTALGDVDGNGDLDIALGSLFGQDLIFFNDGDGITFSITAPTCYDGLTRDLVFGDVDNDGDLDLVEAGHNLDYVCINDGIGGLVERRGFAGGQNWVTWSIALGNADGDDDLDIAAGQQSYRNAVFLNDNGYFSQKLDFTPGGDITYDLAWGDIDTDGDLDLASANQYQRTIVYFNEPASTTQGFTLTHPIFPVMSSYRTLAVGFADVDGDGDLDLIAGQDRAVNLLFLNLSDRYAD